MPLSWKNKFWYGGIPHSETEIDILKIIAKGMKKNKISHKYGVKIKYFSNDLFFN